MCKENHVLVLKKTLYKWVEQGLLQWAWLKKTVHRVEMHWLSGKEKVPEAVVKAKVPYHLPIDRDHAFSKGNSVIQSV